LKTAAGRSTIYLYDRGGNLIAEADETGAVTAEYIWLGSRLLAVVKAGGAVIEADIDFDPDTLNLTSGGRWVTCYIQLPDPYAADGIDPEGVLFNGILPAEKSGVTDHDGDGIGELMVKFSREAVESMLAEGDAVTVTVSGTAGNIGFSGTDVIRVIRRGKDGGKKKKPALFQSAEYAGSAPAGPTGAMEIFYAHPDHLGTPRAMTDASGNVVWKADYRPFGEAEVVIGDVGNEIRFPGQYFDAESGLHYNWHRYYDPKIGRYLRPDPIGFAGGINPFAYVLNNPLNGFDPQGKNPVVIVGALIAAPLIIAAIHYTPEPPVLPSIKWKPAPKPTPDYEGEKRRRERYNRPPDLIDGGKCPEVGPPDPDQCKEMEKFIWSDSFQELPVSARTLFRIMFWATCKDIN